MIQANRAYVKKSGGGRDWPKYLILGIGIYLIWTLFKGVLEIRVAYRRIDEAREILEAEQVRNEEVKRRLAEAGTREYLEKVARNDLNMQLPGETIVVITEVETEKGEASTVKGEEDLPNYVKWWNLIK